jgi:hypothetical protein
MSDQLPAAHIVGTLTAFGVEVDEVDRAVIEAAWEQFGDGMRALLETDLEGVEPEADPDHSRAPADG